MAKATSGWMPTITVVAPRSRVIIAMPRSERETNESMTSRAVTSTMMPRDRWRVTCAITSSWSWSTSVSVSAAWIVAIRNGPCLRIGTAMPGGQRPLARVFRDGVAQRDLVPEQPLGLLDAALEVADGVDLGEVDAERDQRLGDLRREAGDDHAGAHQPGGVDRLHEVVGDRGVDGRDAGDVDHDHAGAVGPDAAEQLLGE